MVHRPENYIPTEQFLAELLESVGGDAYSGSDAAGLAYATEVLRYLGHNVLHADENGVVAVVPGKQPDAALMFQAHTDVVDVQNGWTSNPFRLTPVENGKALQGVGTSDALAAAACFLSLAQRYAYEEPPTTVIFELVSKEENGGLGTFALAPINEQLAARYSDRGCILGEPTDGLFGISYNGAAQYEVRANGAGGHGGRSYKDLLTALDRLQELGVVLRTMQQTHWRRYRDPNYADPTANITGVKFGTSSYNQISPSALAILDLRMPPSMIRDLSTVLDDLRMEGIDLHPLSSDVPRAAHCPEDALIRQFATECYPYIEQIPLFYASDMGGLQDAGWPTVHYSRGHTKRMHQPDERIDRRELHLYDLELPEMVTNFARFVGERAVESTR